jgi:hypothetical protein
MARKPKRLTRPGDESQRTKKGLEIPVPQREEFFRNLGKTATKRPVSHGKAKR